MDLNFEAFMESKGLSFSTKEQYHLYFDKMDTLYSNGLINQETINEFISTYKSNLVRSFVRLYLAYRKIRDIEIAKRTGRVARKKPLIMSREETEALLKVLYAYNEQIALMVDISYNCALRRDEVCNIKVGDIDWDRWKEKRNTGILLIKKAKGNKQRYVLIPRELMVKLVNYVNKIEVTRGNYLFYKNKNNKDTPIPKERYWETYHQAVIRLFGKFYKLHTLRHTKSTEWFEEGVDIVRIQQRLGHSSISTTQLYINPDEKVELQRWQDELEGVE